MEPYQQRVIDEHKELQERRQKLAPFIGSDKYRSLPNDEQNRLRRQHSIMVAYEDVLEERIAHFPEAQVEPTHSVA